MVPFQLVKLSPGAGLFVHLPGPRSGQVLRDSRGALDPAADGAPWAHGSKMASR